MDKPKILIASSNPGKLREFQDIYRAAFEPRDLPFTLLLPSRLNMDLEVEETGNTYVENAALKATAYCDASGLITLADDSGLEVDALDGQPGLHSARYGGDARATDADRRALLLRNLSDKPAPWSARFHCSIVVAVPDGRQFTFNGDLEGEILHEERGENGFGYDRLFYLPSFGKTMAELDDRQKNRISHRALAAYAALPVLNDLSQHS